MRARTPARLAPVLTVRVTAAALGVVSALATTRMARAQQASADSATVRAQVDRVRRAFVAAHGAGDSAGMTRVRAQSGDPDARDS